MNNIVLSSKIVFDHIKYNKPLFSNDINYINGIRYYYTDKGNYKFITIMVLNELIEFHISGNKIIDLHYKETIIDGDSEITNKMSSIISSEHVLELSTYEYINDNDCTAKIILNSFDEESLFCQELQLSASFAKMFRNYLDLLKVLNEQF